MNSVGLIGRVGKDGEVRAVGDSHVLSFSLATSEAWKDGNGKKQERTSWHSVEYWGNGAKALAQYITKGRELGVEGSIRYEEWEKEGVKHNRTKIRAHRLHLIGGKPNGGDRESGGSRREEHSDFQVSDDDVPFSVLLVPFLSALIGAATLFA